MEFIKTKTILTKAKYGEDWFGVDYQMNLYRGCPHGCIYCDSRSHCYHINNFDVVRGKEHAISILKEELLKKKEVGVVGIGAMSDTYNPYEKKYQITRDALELIAKFHFGVALDTKSDLIVRDIDLLKEINSNHHVIIKFTITTPHDELSRIIEPHVCVSSKRLAAMKQLSDEGIFVGVLMNPVLPWITDDEEDIKTLVKLCYEHGAKFIYTYMSVTLRENQRDYYYQKLDEKFPGLRKRYEERFQEKYMCYSPNREKLYQTFVKECKKYGLLYQMHDIVSAYKSNKKGKEQISMF
ncbi:MAG: radical SAM protein [Firmicutes bacterium]|nr:radical SAM protein [Bacillota bacterium]